MKKVILSSLLLLSVAYASAQNLKSTGEFLGDLKLLTTLFGTPKWCELYNKGKVVASEESKFQFSSDYKVTNGVEVMQAIEPCVVLAGTKYVSPFRLYYEKTEGLAAAIERKPTMANYYAVINQAADLLTAKKQLKDWSDTILKHLGADFTRKVVAESFDEGLSEEHESYQFISHDKVIFTLSIQPDMDGSDYDLLVSFIHQ